MSKQQKQCATETHSASCPLLFKSNSQLITKAAEQLIIQIAINQQQKLIAINFNFSSAL